MLEDMLKLTVDVVFPKNGKRRRFTGSSKSPAKPNGRKVSAIGASGINYSGTNNQSLNPAGDLDRIEEEIRVNNESEGHDGADPERAATPLSANNAEDDKEDAELIKQEKARRRIHPVKGYPDNVNMWEKLLNIEKQSTWPSCEHRNTNNRNRYTISVQDRMFKIKKNATYIRQRKPDAKRSPAEASLTGRNEQVVAQAQELVQNELKTEKAADNEKQ